MAEQAQKQEAKVERPQVRKVWLEAGVFLPDAGRLAGEAGRQEIDAESPVARAHRLTMSTCSLGVVCDYVGVRQNGGKPLDVPHRILIPWGPARLADVAPEWKP